MGNNTGAVFPSYPKTLTWPILILAVMSGILLFLSFPKYGSGALAWIALVPLFLALRDVTSVRQGMLLGFVTGITCHIGLIYWIAYVVVNYGHLPIYLGITLMFLLAGYLSLYTALFAAGIIFLRRKIPLYFAAPVLWLVLEYCKSHLLTGFPWENLGYSQYLYHYIVQFADIAGVYGLSLVIVVVNAVLLEIIFLKLKKRIIAVLVVVFVIAGIFVYGTLRSKQIDSYLQNAAGVEVSLIQGNIDQAIKWDEGARKETVNIYEQLSLQTATAKGSLIVWPETAVPFNYQDVSDLQKQVRDISSKTKSWFIFGSTSYDKVTTNENFYNSAYLLSPKGEIKGRYDKVHLVPYGEYVPLRNIFPFIKKLTAGIGDFSRGSGYDPLTIDGKKIGILICYEGILPFAAGAYKRNGAELLVNITNDAWFGATSAPYQHFSMTVFRAIENRLYLVRAANTGISAVVNPKGEIVSQTNIFERAALKGNVKYVNIRTIYAQYGDVLVIFCFILTASYFILALWKRRTKNGGRKSARCNT